MSYGLKLITAPAAEPISLTEAKRRLRVTVTDMDDDITALITECRSQLESESGRAFMPQTWSLFLDEFPNREIRVPLPPLTSVTWIKYYDTNGDLQTLDSAAYNVGIVAMPGRIWQANGYTWPATRLGKPEAVEVRFVAGYAGASTVPAEIKAAIYALIVDRHMNPDGGDHAIPPAVERLRAGAMNLGEWS